MERNQALRLYGCGLAFALVLGCGATRHDGQARPSGPDGAGAEAGTGANASSGGAPPTTQGGSGGSPALNLNGDPKHYRFVRLTNAQWGATVQALLKLPQPSHLEDAFESAVQGTTDFTNNEHLLDVNQRRWADFQSAAEALAERVTASDEALAAVYSGTDALGFIESFGRRAYRRPLTADELSAYRELFTTGSAMSGTKSSFAKGAALVIRAFLQSPHFVYRTELGPLGEPLDGYEAAAKLSLWLRGSTPDDALLDVAESLTDSDRLVDEATQMLSEAGATMRQFHGELLHFDRYWQLSKVGVPSYDPTLNDEFVESSYLFFDNIFSAGLGVRSILTSRRGYMGPGMAALYGLPSPNGGFVEAELDSTRVGYFSQLPYLTFHAANAQPDAIHRGINLALDVLCSALGPPVAELPPLPEPKVGQTRRQRFESVTSPCGGACHKEIIDPLGFAFEHFDGMGQYRDIEEGGLLIDSSGSYTFIDGKVEFADHVELMQAMADSAQAHLCYAKKLSSYALQRDITVKDLPWLTTLAGLSRDDASTRDLVLALVRSKAFRHHGGEP